MVDSTVFVRARIDYSNTPGNTRQITDNGGVAIQQADGLLFTRAGDGTTRVSRLISPAEYATLLSSLGVQAPASVSSSTALAVTDVDRDLYAIGTITLTMPAATAGWGSGIITNDNAVVGLVTLAVPLGASLDGATNGTIVLYPYQRARIRQIGVAAYRTVWVDRAPIIASQQITTPLAAADFNLPAGYSRFRVACTGLVVNGSGFSFGLRLSDNGAMGLKSGASDYATEVNKVTSGTPMGSEIIDSYGYLIQGQNDNGGRFPGETEFILHPGKTDQSPNLKGSSYYRNNTPARVILNYGMDYQGAGIGRVNFVRLFTSGGSFTANITIIGEP